jgi:uncharacterized protein YegP (UPF0339 family)
VKKELYKDAANEHRWRLVGDNGAVVAAASEGFASKQKANQNLALVLALENDSPTIQALATAEGVLSGDRLVPREVARLNFNEGWTEYEKLVDMTAVVFAESAGYVEAVAGPTRYGSYKYGLYLLDAAQDGSVSEEEFKAMAFDPVRAAEVARQLYVSAGYSFRPWVSHANGAYKNHLLAATLGVANFWAERIGLDPVPRYKYV